MYQIWCLSVIRSRIGIGSVFETFIEDIAQWINNFAKLKKRKNTPSLS